MNDTETRALLHMMHGARAPRHHTTEQVTAQMDAARHAPTHQDYVRKRTQAYLTKNWEFVKELVPCDGDCASPTNKCSDAQATACYNDNLTQIENA